MTGSRLCFTILFQEKKRKETGGKWLTGWGGWKWIVVLEKVLKLSSIENDDK